MLPVGYSYGTQLFPAAAARLMQRKPVTVAGAIAGILSGVVVASLLTLTHATIGTLIPVLSEVKRDLSVGTIALATNVAVLVAVSALTQSRVVPTRQHADIA